jgi:hypothetical protein
LQQPVALVGLRVRLLGIQRCRYLRWRHPTGHELTDLVHLFVGIVDVEKRSRVPEVQVRLLIFLLQDLQDTQVAADLVNVRRSKQIKNLRLLRLPIAIHAPVALLKDHQRPWQVKMDKAMAEVMQIQSLGGHI